MNQHRDTLVSIDFYSLVLFEPGPIGETRLALVVIKVPSYELVDLFEWILLRPKTAF